jgi:hypothetical protein
MNSANMYQNEPLSGVSMRAMCFETPNAAELPSFPMIRKDVKTWVKAGYSMNSGN